MLEQLKSMNVLGRSEEDFAACETPPCNEIYTGENGEDDALVHMSDAFPKQ